MHRKFKSSHIWIFGLALSAVLLIGFYFSPKETRAATLNLFSDKQSLAIGDEFTVDIKLNSENIGINAAQAVLQFSQDSVSAIKIDKTDSVFNFWLVEPEINNALGTVSFIGGSTSGFSGASLQVLRVTFKVKGTGAITMTFNDSAVTAADGSGTNVLSATKGLELQSVAKTESVNIGPSQIDREPEVAANAPKKPVVTVSLYPDPTNWYNLSADFSAGWQLPRDITGVAAVLNKVPTTLPIVSEGLFDNKFFSALSNGVWYLHVRFKNNIGWGVANHYRIAIDSVPPLPFEVQVNLGESLDNPSPSFFYRTRDQFSGIENYSVQIDNIALSQTAKDSFVSSPLPPGTHIVKVIAADKAGNKTESSASFKIIGLPAPQILAVSRDVYVGEGGLSANGLALASANLLITVKNDRDQGIYEIGTTSDENGYWSISIDRPFKKGIYYFEAIVKDSRGASSLPARSENLKLLERPLFILFNQPITASQFLILLSVLIIGILLQHYFFDKLINKKITKNKDIIKDEVGDTLDAIKGKLKSKTDVKKVGKIKEHLLNDLDNLS